jgi:hypothetical protein
MDNQEIEEIKWNYLKCINYVIKNDKIYNGKFVGYVAKKIISGWHELTIGWYMIFDINNEERRFDEKCKYYEAKQYYQYYARQAQESMERRALDKILKRVVNEEFQW